jgi:hypothetical protein
MPLAHICYLAGAAGKFIDASQIPPTVMLVSPVPTRENTAGQES